jgi:S1-C subfamily serine protease
MVVSVEPGSPGDAAGLRRDMIISQVAAGRMFYAIESVSDFTGVLRGLESGMTVAFRVHYRPDQSSDFMQTYLPLTIP